MNLVPILTGDVRPTCDANGVHTAFVMILEGHPVRFIIRPNLPLHLMVAWVCSDIAKALGSKNPSVAGESLNLIEGEDKGYDTIVTPGGPQRLRVFTSKGLTKFLMKSRHPAAESFCDELAKKNDDLMYYGIAFRGNLSAAEMISGLEARFTEKLAAVMEDNRRLRVDFMRAIANEPRATLAAEGMHPSHLFPYSAEEVERLQAQGFWVTKTWLENERVPSSQLSRLAASLVRRAKAYFAGETQLRNKMTRTLRRPNPSGKRVWLVHEKYLNAIYYGSLSPEGKAVLRRSLEILKRDDLAGEAAPQGDQGNLFRMDDYRRGA